MAEKNIGESITFNVENGGKYLILAHVDYAILDSARSNFSEATELGLTATSGGNTAESVYYLENWWGPPGQASGLFGASHMMDIQADGNTITVQRFIRGNDRVNNGRYGGTKVVLLRVG